MDKKEIKQKITTEIAKTKELVQEYREMSKPVSPDDAIGRLSRMDAINNKSVTESSLRKAEEKLKALERALGKVDSPEFGICQRCHAEIPLGRIMFRPESVFCVNCAR